MVMANVDLYLMHKCPYILYYYYQLHIIQVCTHPKVLNQMELKQNAMM